MVVNVRSGREVGQEVALDFSDVDATLKDVNQSSLDVSVWCCL